MINDSATFNNFSLNYWGFCMALTLFQKGNYAMIFI